jgi:hypothetical protein
MHRTLSNEINIITKFVLRIFHSSENAGINFNLCVHSTFLCFCV